MTLTEQPVEKHESSVSFIITIVMVLVVLLLAPMWDDPLMHPMVSQEDYDNIWLPIAEKLKTLPADENNTQDVSIVVYEGVAKQGLLPIFNYNDLLTQEVIIARISKVALAHCVLLKNNILDASDVTNIDILLQILYAAENGS
ncbi:MAG: hypothetical protein HRU15_20740 [Planctomycetes bacterium]|nr:hypothetical protein [Planctomycetota bacterium]